MDRVQRGGPWTWGPYFVYVRNSSLSAFIPTKMTTISLRLSARVNTRVPRPSPETGSTVHLLHLHFLNVVVSQQVALPLRRRNVEITREHSGKFCF